MSGMTKYLTCATDSANPAAVITWTRNDYLATEIVSMELNNGLDRAFIVSSTINIETTTDHNGDVYKCQISHVERNLFRSFVLNITCECLYIFEDIVFEDISNLNKAHPLKLSQA